MVADTIMALGIYVVIAALLGLTFWCLWNGK